MSDRKSDQQMDRLTDHDYDGIQEYDNRLPHWWVGTFVLTVLFGLGYWLYYHVYSVGPDQIEEYAMSVEAHQKKYAESGAAATEIADDDIMKLVSDKAALSEAKTLFLQNCAACHGVEGQGVIGPNLADDYWIHGGRASQIYGTIMNGVPEKGMIAWKGTLKPEQISNLTAFLISLKGSNPANAKPPEGELVQ